MICVIYLCIEVHISRSSIAQTALSRKMFLGINKDHLFAAYRSYLFSQRVKCALYSILRCIVAILADNDHSKNWVNVIVEF